ncbi:12179_t:CDS:2, partial [Entrophospora sp. SA101]
MESIMKHKHLTDKQILYIFNRVMIPRLEYRLQLTLLSENECKILGAKCRKLFKQKVGLASTVTNAVTNTHTIYNLCDLWDCQVQHHITNLCVRLNDNGIMGKISKIKLHQLQLNLCLPKSPLESWNYSVSHLHLFKNNLMAGILCIAKFFKFSLRTTYDFESFIIKVLYLDQILCCEGTHLLSWKQAVLRLKINICGRKPKWFSSLEESILHHSSHEVLDQWKLPRCNSFPIQYSLNFPKDSRIRPFIATYQFEEITF